MSEKKGDVINLIEVKAKSWNPLEDTFVSKNGKSTNKAIRPYLYDVAFQKYVIVQALKEMFPEKNFKVNAFLMLADNSSIPRPDTSRILISSGHSRLNLTRMKEQSSVILTTRIRFFARFIGSLKPEMNRIRRNYRISLTQ